MAESTKMHFGMLSRVGSGNKSYTGYGDIDAPMRRVTFGVSDKHCKA